MVLLPPKYAEWGPSPYLSTPLGMAAWMRFVGKAFSYIFAQLRKIFPFVSPAQIGKVTSQEERIESVLRKWAAGPPTAKLFRQDIPRDAAIPKAYRYHTKILFVDRQGKVATGFDVILDESRQLTRGELDSRAKEMAVQLMKSGSDPEGRVSKKAIGKYMLTEVLLVTRRT